MNEREHYPQRKVTLLPGDTIWATYKQNPNAPVRIAPATLKRLYGWKEGQRYIGKVREEPPTNSTPEGRVVVDFYDDKKGKFQCTHLVYNVEHKLAKGELYDLRYIPNPQPRLFDEP